MKFTFEFLLKIFGIPSWGVRIIMLDVFTRIEMDEDLQVKIWSTKCICQVGQTCMGHDILRARIEQGNLSIGDACNLPQF